MISVYLPNALLKNLNFFLRFLYLCLFIFERLFLSTLPHSLPVGSSHSVSSSSTHVEISSMGTHHPGRLMLVGFDRSILAAEKCS